MPISLNPNSSMADVTSSVNYLMATLGQGFNSVTVSQATGIIANPYNQNNLGWSYQYINVRYSTSSDGTANFSTVPANATYYGLRNTSTTTASTNPTDYVWFEVSGGFGVTKSLFYSAIGGRQVMWAAATVVPNDNYQPTINGQAVDLDIPTLVNLAINSNTANTALTAVTVLNSAQPNITSVGTMISVTSTGNITGNLIVGNNFVYPNGVTIINTYSNANVTAYIPTDAYIANITGNVVTLQGNIVTLTNALANTNSNVANLEANSYANSNVTSFLSNTTISISTTGNVSAAYFVGNGSQLSNIATVSLLTQSTPGNTSAGTAGQIVWDSNYIYVCVATNTWHRASLLPY